MTPFRAAGPLLISLTLAVGAALLLAHADDAVGGARLRQAAGLTRGAIVDRYGRPLARTIDAAGKAKRIYPLPSSVSIVGYRGPKGHWHGLESKYNSLLSAEKARHDWKTLFLNLRGDAAQGDTVQLTLDAKLQQVADRALGKARGAVVAMDPRSGDVLAMVSKPYCPPGALAAPSRLRKCSQAAGKPLLNRATQLLLPPGSAFKIVTLSAALDTGEYSLSTVFSGTDVFGPSPYFDNSAYPSNITRSDLTQLTLAQALAFSDNFTFAHIGLTLGARTFLRYAQRFLVGRSIPFDFPVKPSVVASGNAQPSASVLARSSFGAPTDKVTPLQMALIASAVANRGTLMVPHLVRTLRSSDGRVTFRYHDRALSHVMSRRAARQVTAGMTFVVDHGSGYRARIAGMKVAGKTGTAASGGSNPHAWFIAFAPASHPVVAVAVLHEYSGEGFQYAAPIARKVMIAALRERGYHVH